MVGVDVALVELALAAIVNDEVLWAEVVLDEFDDENDIPTSTPLGSQSWLIPPQCLPEAVTIAETIQCKIGRY